MTCKGICKRYKAVRGGTHSRYAEGQVRCQVCELFITVDGCDKKSVKGGKALYCKCCGYRVRTKPRSRVYKAKLRARNSL